MIQAGLQCYQSFGDSSSTSLVFNRFFDFVQHLRRCHGVIHGRQTHWFPGVASFFCRGGVTGLRFLESCFAFSLYSLLLSRSARSGGCGYVQWQVHFIFYPQMPRQINSIAASWHCVPHFCGH